MLKATIIFVCFIGAAAFLVVLLYLMARDEVEEEIYRSKQAEGYDAIQDFVTRSLKSKRQKPD